MFSSFLGSHNYKHKWNNRDDIKLFIKIDKKTVGKLNVFSILDYRLLLHVVATKVNEEKLKSFIEFPLDTIAPPSKTKIRFIFNERT